MTKTEINSRSKKEANRIKRLLADAGISPKRIKLMDPVILNTAWMKAKLDDARDAIKSSQVVMSYDNGGGQKGLRENPLFKGYESLWKSYMQGMCKILDSLPEEAVQKETEEVDKPKTVLELVRSKHVKEA